MLSNTTEFNRWDDSYHSKWCKSLDKPPGKIVKYEWDFDSSTGDIDSVDSTGSAKNLWIQLDLEGVPVISVSTSNGLMENE